MSLKPNTPEMPEQRMPRSRKTRAARLALTAAIVLVPVLAAASTQDAAQQVPASVVPPTTRPADNPTTRPADNPTTRPADNPVAAPADPTAEPQQDPAADDPFAADAAVPAPSAVDASQPTVSYDLTAETVEINVSDANLLDVLRMLSVQARKNIVASQDVRGTVTCNLFDVTVEEALEAILRSNGYVAREDGNFIYVYTQEEAAAMDQANRRQETRVFRLYHIPPEMAAEAIMPALSEGVQPTVTDEAAQGVGSSREDAGGFSYSNGDTLIVRDYTENLDEVARILQDLDHRPEQVLIEATILSTKLTESNAFGVDFNVVGGVDFSQFTTNSGGQVVGSQIGSTETVDSFSNPAHGAGTGNNFTSPIAGGLKLGFVSNNVSAFVAALEGITDTTVLANPKVLALNKQRGEVLVGREDGYLTTTITETTATQTVQMLQTGTRLIFRPYISRDGYIRLEIHPEDSVGGVNSLGLPFKSTTEVTSNVMVKDGHTIVIGGLFREQASTSRSQIPVLGNLPIIGAAFRRHQDVTEREEIIILLTPHIVKDYERYGQISEQELKRAEKLRVGMRKGMMPTGRERMSQVHYEKAVRELARDNPNRRRANYHLNCAINLNPTFIEAIELKEKLNGRVVVEADQSTIRSFVRRSMLHDVREDGQPLPEDRPDRDPVVPEPQSVLPVSTEDGPTTRPADGPTTRPAGSEGPTTRPGAGSNGGRQWVDVKD